MPAPYWGYISPEKQKLEEDLIKAQISSLEEESRMRTAQLGEQIAARAVQQQQVGMQYMIQERTMNLNERKQMWAEEQAQRPTLVTVGGSLLSLSPEGDVTEAWQAPPEPLMLSAGQALVDPLTGEPLYSPPQLTATDTELIVTDRSTGKVINRIPIEQVEPNAQFSSDKYGNVVALDPQTGVVLNEYKSPEGRELMQREAKEYEQDYQFKLSADKRAWEGMEISKEMAVMANITEQQRIQINADLTREGYDVSREGFVVSERTADKANLSTEQIAKLNVATTQRGQDIQLELGISDIELRETLGTGQLEVAVRAEDRAWEAMYIDKTLAEAAGVREESRVVLDAILRREGFAITKYGIEVSQDQAARAQIGETERTQINAAVTKRGQDLQYELGVDTLGLQELLGMGELEVKREAEKRAWATMYITKGIADRANITDNKRIDVNERLAEEGYDIQRDGQAIQERIAEMADLTEREKTDLMIGIQEKQLRIDSARVDAEIERGKFIQMGDVIVKRNEDESLEIAFEMPAEQYPLTPIKVGDDKSGYRIGLIDPYKGTVDWFDALPGGAAGADDAKMHLDLLNIAKNTVDPGNTFLTTIDPEVKNNIYRQTMAFYSSLLQAPRPGGLGYTPEQAARFSTPMELWRTGDTTLSFGGVTPEPTPELFEKYIRGVPYSKAVPLTKPGEGVTPFVQEPGTATGKKELTLPEWVNVFSSLGSGDSIKYLQQYMKDNDLWDGEADGVWSVDLERKFKIAYNRGKLELGMRGE